MIWAQKVLWGMSYQSVNKEFRLNAYLYNFFLLFQKMSFFHRCSSKHMRTVQSMYVAHWWHILKNKFYKSFNWIMRMLLNILVVTIWCVGAEIAIFEKKYIIFTFVGIFQGNTLQVKISVSQKSIFKKSFFWRLWKNGESLGISYIFLNMSTKWHLSCK